MSQSTKSGLVPPRRSSRGVVRSLKMITDGYEIFVPALREAMQSADVQPWWGCTAQLMQRLDSHIQQTERRLQRLEQRKLKQYKATDDLLLEEAVTSAVEVALEDGEAVVPCRYEFQGAGGDLDGMVVGRWQGDEVVVLCEAKHNMDSGYSKAKDELLASFKYWERLGALQPGEEVSDAELADMGALRVSEFKGRKVMLAFGGAKFSDLTADRRLQGLSTPWFRVVPDLTGKYRACLFVSSS